MGVAGHQASRKRKRLGKTLGAKDLGSDNHFVQRRNETFIPYKPATQKPKRLEPVANLRRASVMSTARHRRQRPPPTVLITGAHRAASVRTTADRARAAHSAYHVIATGAGGPAELDKPGAPRPRAGPHASTRPVARCDLGRVDSRRRLAEVDRLTGGHGPRRAGEQCRLSAWSAPLDRGSANRRAAGGQYDTNVFRAWIGGDPARFVPAHAPTAAAARPAFINVLQHGRQDGPSPFMGRVQLDPSTRSSRCSDAASASSCARSASMSS